MLQVDSGNYKYLFKIMDVEVDIDKMNPFGEETSNVDDLLI